MQSPPHTTDEQVEETEHDRLVAEVCAERAAQGLPPKIEDPGFYRKFAVLIDTETDPI